MIIKQFDTVLLKDGKSELGTWYPYNFRVLRNKDGKKIRKEILYLFQKSGHSKTQHAA